MFLYRTFQGVYRSIPQTSKMENFATTVNNLTPLTIIATLSISHVYMDPDYASSPSLLLFAWLCYLCDIWTTSMCYNCQLNFASHLILFPQLPFLAWFYYFDLLIWKQPLLFWFTDMKPALIVLICWYEVHCQLNFASLLILFPQLHFLACLYCFDLLIWNPPLLFWFVDMRSTPITLIYWYEIISKVVVGWINTYCI